MAIPEAGRQYHYWPAGDAYDAWDVAALIQRAATLPVVRVAIDEIPEIDTNYWFHAGHEPTVRNLVEHVRHAREVVDPSYPVILGPDNRVMDGMHRIVRALLDGQSHVRAVRFDVLPPPDLTGCELGAAGG